MNLDDSISDFHRNIVIKFDIKNIACLNNIFKCYFWSKFMTLENISISILSELFLVLKLAKCPCLSVIPTDLTVRIIEHMWTKLTCADTCHNIIKIYSYFVVANDFPNDDDFAAFLNHDNMITNNPDEYCEENKILTPMNDTDKLKTNIAEHDISICSICQETVKKGEKYIILKCKHVYHADSNCCLGDGKSIYTWFDRSHKCPNCNTDIVII